MGTLCCQNCIQGTNKHTHTHKTLFCCVPFLTLSFLARRFGRLSRRKNTFPFVPLQGNSRLAPRICATTAQREVQCVADHLWIHHQGQADTCQGKRHENLILSLERIGGPSRHESSVTWPWSLKVTHKGRNTGFGVKAVLTTCVTYVSFFILLCVCLSLNNLTSEFKGLWM